MNNSSETMEARRLWNYTFKVLTEKKSHNFLSSASLLQEYEIFGHRHGGKCLVKMEAEVGVRHQ